MVVGGKDSGKTTITLPLRLIFKCFITPPASSTAPLLNCRGHELFLWQDFRYFPGKPGRKEDVGLQIDEGCFNRLLEGEPTLIEVPKNAGVDFVFSEDTPFVATGPFEFQAYKDGVPNAYETDQLATRMQYFHFGKSVPVKEQNDSLKPCAACYAKWLLHGEIVHRAHHGKHASSTTTIVEEAHALLFPGPYALKGYGVMLQTKASSSSAGSGSSSSTALGAGSGEKRTYEKLREVVEWKREGLLSEEEFAKAKTRILSEM